MPQRSYLIEAKARVAIIVIALLCLVPALVGLFDDDRHRSAWENRALSTLPERAGLLRHPTKYFSELDEYIDDHFGFAVELNFLYRMFVFHVLADSPATSITLGRDGFVFMSGSPSRLFSRFEGLCIGGIDPKTSRETVEGWLSMLAHLSGRGFDVIAAIAPSKPSLYPEKLPDSVPLKYRSACARYPSETSPPVALQRDAQQAGLKVIYPIELFRKHRYDGNFYPKENFHWSGQSAHLFARLLFARLGIQTPLHFQCDDCEERSVRTNDLKNMFGFTRGLLQKSYRYREFGIDTRPGEPSFVASYFSRPVPYGTFHSSRPMTELRALMLSNSFGRPIAHHVAAAFRSTTWIEMNRLLPNEAPAVFGEMIDRISPDVVILLAHDGGMQNLNLRALAPALR